MVSAHAGGLGGFGGEGEQRSAGGSSGAWHGTRSPAAWERPRGLGVPTAHGAACAESSHSPGDPHGDPLHSLAPSVRGCFRALRGVRAARVSIGLLLCPSLVSFSGQLQELCLSPRLTPAGSPHSPVPIQPPVCAAEKLLIQQVLVIWVSLSLCSLQTGPESCCSLHVCARRRRVFRQGQQKSKELSWG